MHVCSTHFIHMNRIEGTRVMPIRRTCKRTIFGDKGAASHVISATMLTSVAITLGLIVLAWTQSQSSDFTRQYSETTSAETAKIRERLAVEYAVYDEDEVWIYLLNWGKIDDVEIQTVIIKKGTWHPTTSTPTLKFLNGTLIPDQDLDMGEEGYINVPVSNLEIGCYYSFRIVTVRGAVFDSSFVA